MKYLHEKIKLHNLLAGEIFFAYEPCMISTILGSCIAITMYSKKLAFGGVCHALLPGPAINEEDASKYVFNSVGLMLSEFTCRNIPVKNIVVKLFGGANVIGNHSGVDHIGKQNVDMAYNILSKNSLKLQTQDVGGIYGRKLFFYTHSGEVFVKKVKDKRIFDQELIAVKGYTTNE